MNPSTPGRASLAVIFLTVFIDLLGFGMVLPLLPSYAKDFAGTIDERWRYLVLGSLMSSFSAMQFLFAPLWGRLSDRVGRRPVLIIGLAGSVVFYALFGVAALANSLALLFVSRIGAGIAGATIPTAQAYIADCTTVENRARGMAMIGAAFGLGFTLGPLLGAVALIPDSGGAASPWPGFGAAALSAVAVVLAVWKLPESLDPHHRRASAQGERLSLRDVLAVPTIGMLIVMLFVAGFAFANFESTLSLLLKGRFDAGATTQPADLDDAMAGVNRQILFVFAFIGVTLTLSQGLLVRRLAGRFSESALLAGGCIVSAIGFAWLALVGPHGALGWVLVALFVEIVGFSFVTPALNAMISRRSDPAKQGRILGVAQSTSALSRIFGPLLGMELFGMWTESPYWAAAGLMIVVLAMVHRAARGGDFGTPDVG